MLLFAKSQCIFIEKINKTKVKMDDGLGATSRMFSPTILDFGR